MNIYTSLQHYWWVLVSLLGAILVFLMFVQGGQSLLFGTAKNREQEGILLTLFGHKWELTFTTLVTFGGAAFASFPLFYSTSFGGAYWLWILILLSFVLQAVSYEFYGKEKNLLGNKVYKIFLLINGIAGPVLLGVAVGSLFTGGNFVVDKLNIASGSSSVISYWTNDYKGLELIANPINLLLGFTVFLAARTLGLLYTRSQCSSMGGEAASELKLRADSQLKISGIAFVLFFVVFVLVLFLGNCYKVNPQDPSFNGVVGTIFAEPYGYLHNMLQVWWIGVLFLVGVVIVLVGLGRTILMHRNSFYITGLGVLLAVWGLLLCAGFNDTSFFHSNAALQDSLTLYNASSSLYTLRAMSWASLAIPFVLAYIIIVWRKMTPRKRSKN